MLNLLERKARLIAFYLPQFHPIPENDEWWGTGFTEWTNSSKARPLFPGHYQPHIPADLGYYDLRLPEARLAQAEMAEAHGIEGFCYWHYWFGNGRRLLERPFNEVVESGVPDFPFCLGWANQTWTGIWHGSPNRILIQQRYPGITDYEAHFDALVEAFHDKRYIQADGKPVFVVYNVKDLPDSSIFAECWQKRARRSGLKGIHFVAHSTSSWAPTDEAFDATVLNTLFFIFEKLEQSSKDPREIWRRILKRPLTYSYQDAIRIADLPLRENVLQYPSVFPNWDNTPRSGRRGIVLRGSTPDLFRTHLKQAVARVSHRDFDQRIIFIKSWNEWAEGNHLEPDLKFGKAYLEVIKEEIFEHFIPSLPASPTKLSGSAAYFGGSEAISVQGLLRPLKAGSQ